MKKVWLFLLGLVVLVAVMGCELDGSSDLPDVEPNPMNLLYYEESDYTFGSSEVFLWFVSPEDFGATGYTVQYSQTGVDDSFVNFDEGSGILETGSQTDASGYGVTIPDDEGWFRLAITGGEFDGEVSNKVFATKCTIVADISWSLDYSMANTGIMFPNVGCGLVATFTVVDSVDAPIEDCLTYQWYRVDPNNWEHEELIVGETTASYTTTSQDRGKQILIKATGTPTGFPGGFCQVYTDWVVE